jgi:glycosyltransferase involved in cell wall biosynthesis
MPLSQPTYFPLHKRLYLRLTYGILARSGRKIITVSEFSRREIHERLGIPLERILCIPSGVDEEFFAQGDPPWPGEVPPKPYLLAVSAAYPHKRLPVLVRAFELVARSAPELVLVLVGTFVGQAREQTRLNETIERSSVRNRIVRLPPVQWGLMPSLYARATALVHASAYEGFGLPIAEAMASGLPVVAAPAEGVQEVLGEWGATARGGEASDLQDAIERLLSWHPRERERQVQGARRFAEAAYRWTRVAECLAKEFRGADDTGQE